MLILRPSTKEKEFNGKDLNGLKLINIRRV